MEKLVEKEFFSFMRYESPRNGEWLSALDGVEWHYDPSDAVHLYVKGVLAIAWTDGCLCIYQAPHGNKRQQLYVKIAAKLILEGL